MNHSDQDSPVVFDFYKRKEKTKNTTVDTVSNMQAGDLDKIYTSKKLQIVILDLDVKAMSTLGSLLKSRYDVHYCTSPVDALRLIGTKKIALIISEQALPNMNVSGADFLKKVKKIAPLTMRILLAGQLDFGKAKYSIEKDDVFKLVKKPFDDNRMLDLIDMAIEQYLDKSGSLAAALEKMSQHSPNIAKPIQMAKSISPAANPVIIKSSAQDFFNEIKENYPDKAFFIPAKNKDVIIKVLETTVVKSLVYCFEKADASEDEILFLEQIKQELPHLAIIVVMSKDGVNYQQIINLLTNKIIFNYLPFNTKPEKFYQQLKSAIDCSNRVYSEPVYLVWPPLVRFEPKDDEETISEALKDVSQKVREGVLSGIQTVKGFFKKKD